MSARRTRSSTDSLPATPEGKPKRSARALASVIERSSRIQGPAAAAYVERLRRADPDADPAAIVAKLEKRYVTAVTASGAAVGSTAVLPGLGTLAALSAAAGETAVFLEATAFYALAIAAVYGVLTEDRERRRAMVLSVLVGDDSKQAMSDLIGGGRTSGAWLSEGVASLPLSSLSQLNSSGLSDGSRCGAARCCSASSCRSGSAPSSAPSATDWRARRSCVTPATRSASRRRDGRSTCSCCRRFPTPVEREIGSELTWRIAVKGLAFMGRPVGAAAGETGRHRVPRASAA
jgi:hypothetical protein